MAMVSIVMGSDSDMPVMKKAADVLGQLGKLTTFYILVKLYECKLQMDTIMVVVVITFSVLEMLLM